MCVQIARARFGVEYGTDFLVAVLIERVECVLILAEESGCEVTGKRGFEAANRILHPPPNPAGPLWIVLFQVRHSGAQTGRVQLADGEHTDAALRASDTARQPLTAPMNSLGEFRIHDLDELSVAGWQGRHWHGTYRISKIATKGRHTRLKLKELMTRPLFIIAAFALASVVGTSAQQAPKSTDASKSTDSTKDKSAEKFPFPEDPTPQAPNSTDTTKTTDSTKEKSAAEKFPFPEPEAPTAPPRSAPRGPNDSSSKDRNVDISPPADDEKHEGSDLVGPDPAPGVVEMLPWNPHKADKDVEVGIYYFKQKNYSAAESRFREALHWQDNHAEATYRLALSLEKQGKTPEAKQYYLQYLKILPNGELAKDARKALDRITGEGSNKAENKPPTSRP
jgi:hypothetical protein